MDESEKKAQMAVKVSTIISKSLRQKKVALATLETQTNTHFAQQ
jgi:hypothetical protein